MNIHMWKYECASFINLLHVILVWKNYITRGLFQWRFANFSKIFSRNLCDPEIVLLIRISSWNCVWVPKALGTRIKFQLQILTINVIPGIVYFREIILESSRNVSETTPDLPVPVWCPRVYVYSATTMWKSSNMILYGMYHCYSSYLQRSYGPVDIIPINAILVHSDMNIERCAVSIPSVLISGQSNRQYWTSCEYCFRLKK